MTDTPQPYSWIGVIKPGATDRTCTGYFYDANGNRIHFTGIRMPNGDFELRGATDTQVRDLPK